MKTFLRKIYHRLTAPLKRSIISDMQAANAAERTALVTREADFARLEGEIQQLRQLVDEQDRYIAELRGAGLHELLSQYSVSENRNPKIVVSALVDVVSGMQPSTASGKYKINADEIIDWVGVFAEHIKLNDLSVGARRHDERAHGIVSTAPQVEAESNVIELLERQLEFNSKNYLDRERIDSLELARLQQELTIEKMRPNRVVAGK